MRVDVVERKRPADGEARLVPLYFFVHGLIQFLHAAGLEGLPLEDFGMPEQNASVSPRGQGMKFSKETGRQLSGRIMGVASLNGTQRVLELLSILDALAQSDHYAYLSSPGFSNAYAERDALKINKVYAYTINNFMNRIRQQEVAAVTNLSAVAFCRYFKSRTRKTYSRFLGKVKIGYACQLLMEGTADIALVCYQSGYNNVSNFNRQFTAIMKAPPSEYCRKHNKVLDSA